MSFWDTRPSAPREREIPGNRSLIMQEQMSSPERYRDNLFIRSSPTYDPFAGRSIDQPFLSRSEQRVLGSSLSSSEVPTSTQAQQTLFASRTVPLPTNVLHQTQYPLPSFEVDLRPERRRSSQESYHHDTDSSRHSVQERDYEFSILPASDSSKPPNKYHNRRRRTENHDEFDGPTQLLGRPHHLDVADREGSLPPLPVHLSHQEQQEINLRLNHTLSTAAFHFMAKYEFPIPVESDKPTVRQPTDREWAEWAHLLKRLGTKRRIPARVLYENQIRQFVTVVEHTLAVRGVPHASAPQLPSNQTDNTAGGSIGGGEGGRGASISHRMPLKDDRNVLQMISAGLQLAKMIKDAVAMAQLNTLYVQTESLIRERQASPLQVQPHGGSTGLAFYSSLSS